jgi:transposase-like protein
MDPQRQFCHNPACRACGRVGEGHIEIHSRKERRYRCKRCGQTFSATRGTALYRLHQPVELVVTVVTLLAHGCPLQAIVAAFGLDERTVAHWQARAGAQGRRVHERLVESGRLDLGQVQADELRVRVVGGVVWLATALAVPTRLWLGGVVSARRDHLLLRALLAHGRGCAASAAFLRCTDGLAAYAAEVVRAFRRAVRTGRVGRPRLAPAAGLLIGRAIKRYAKRRVVAVTRQIVQGTAQQVQAALVATQGRAEAVINTAYAERLNATFRTVLAPLARRTRRAVHDLATLEAAMWLAGSCYNLCTAHRSLRQRAGDPEGRGPRWQARTPAMAAGLSDHCWTIHELLAYPVPIAGRPKRGRRPKWLLAAAAA